MDRTSSNLTLAALLLAVGYIVGQAVGPRGADAGVAAVREDRVVTTREDGSGNLIVWELAGARVVRATSFSMTTDGATPVMLAREYAAPTTVAPGR
ncbi:MAG: hypothetical protein AB7U23_14740 [Dehalococcoidia bacterium]